MGNKTKRQLAINENNPAQITPGMLKIQALEKKGRELSNLRFNIIKETRLTLADHILSLFFGSGNVLLWKSKKLYRWIEEPRILANQYSEDEIKNIQEPKDQSESLAE